MQQRPLQTTQTPFYLTIESMFWMSTSFILFLTRRRTEQATTDENRCMPGPGGKNVPVFSDRISSEVFL